MVKIKTNSQFNPERLFDAACRRFDADFPGDEELLGELTEIAERGSTQAMIALTILYSGHESAWIGSNENFYIKEHLKSDEKALYWALKASNCFTTAECGHDLLRFFDHLDMDNEDVRLHALAATLRVLTLYIDTDIGTNVSAIEFMQKHFKNFDFLSVLQRQQALKQAEAKVIGMDNDLFSTPSP